MNLSKVKASTVHVPGKKNNACLNKTLVFRFSSDYLTEWPRFSDTVVQNLLQQQITVPYFQPLHTNNLEMAHCRQLLITLS